MMNDDKVPVAAVTANAVAVDFSVESPMRLERVNSSAKEASSYSSPRDEGNMSGKAVEGWKFALSPRLENGAKSLAPEEKVMASWTYTSTNMSFEEWIYTIFTFGIYWLATRCYLRRRRTYSIFVTDRRVVVKEEMFQSVGLMCLEKMLLEDQASYSIADLKYVCTEQNGEQFFGMVPPSVTLDLYFKNAPAWISLPPSIYQPGSKMFEEPFFKAFETAYGINLKADAVKKIKQIIANAHKFQDPSVAMHFCVRFFIECVKQFYMSIYYAMIGAYTDPSIGPRQINRMQDATHFRWYCDISEDPECISHVHTILVALGENHVNKVKIDLPSCAEKAHAGVKLQNSFAVNEPSNTKQPYGVYSGFNYYTNLFPLVTDERIVDTSENNDYWTWADIRAVINSFGAYYVFTFADKVRYGTKSYFLTDRRLVRQHLILAPIKNKVQYARADVWLIDAGRDVYHTPEMPPLFGIRRTKTSALIIGNKNFSLDIEVANKAFAYALLKVILSRRSKRPDMIAMMPRDALASTAELQQAPLTLNMLAEDEAVESSVFTYARLSTVTTCINCGLGYVPKRTMTLTNFGVYLESYEGNYCGTMACWDANFSFCCPQFGRRANQVTFQSWDGISGVYWSNFEYYRCGFGGNTYCCGLCDRGDEKAGIQGYSGSRLYFNTGMEGFDLGLDIPRRFYAQNDSKLNAMVDTASLANYQRTGPVMATAVPVSEKRSAEGEEKV